MLIRCTSIKSRGMYRTATCDDYFFHNLYPYKSIQIINCICLANCNAIEYIYVCVQNIRLKIIISLNYSRFTQFCFANNVGKKRWPLHAYSKRVNQNTIVRFRSEKIVFSFIIYFPVSETYNHSMFERRTHIQASR